jgi:hypothetical protein
MNTVGESVAKREISGPSADEHVTHVYPIVCRGSVTHLACLDIFRSYIYGRSRGIAW